MTKDILARNVFILMDKLEALDIPEEDILFMMNRVHHLVFDAELSCNDSPLMSVWNAVDIWIESYCYRDLIIN